MLVIQVLVLFFQLRIQLYNVSPSFLSVVVPVAELHHALVEPLDVVDDFSEHVARVEAVVEENVHDVVLEVVVEGPGHRVFFAVGGFAAVEFYGDVEDFEGKGWG